MAEIVLRKPNERNNINLHCILYNLFKMLYQQSTAFVPRVSLAALTLLCLCMLINQGFVESMNQYCLRLKVEEKVIRCEESSKRTDSCANNTSHY